MSFTLDTSALPNTGNVLLPRGEWDVVARGQVDRVTKLYTQCLQDGVVIANYLIQLVSIEEAINSVHLFQEKLIVADVEQEWTENDWFKACQAAQIVFDGNVYNNINFTQDPDVIPSYVEPLIFPDGTTDVVTTLYYYFDRAIDDKVEKLFAAFETNTDGEKMLQFWIGYELPADSFKFAEPPEVEEAATEVVEDPYDLATELEGTYTEESLDNSGTDNSVTGSDSND